jgi:hypothetical protein
MMRLEIITFQVIADLTELSSFSTLSPWGHMQKLRACAFIRPDSPQSF